MGFLNHADYGPNDNIESRSKSWITQMIRVSEWVGFNVPPDTVISETAFRGKTAHKHNDKNKKFNLYRKFNLYETQNTKKRPKPKFVKKNCQL